VVAAGVLAPLVRRKVTAPPLAMQTLAFCAPIGLCVATRRSRTRDVATCCLQMWAYVAAYKSPHDKPTAQARRVHIDYPIAIDRTLGWGELPTTRLQHRLARVGPHGPEWRTLDKVLVWAHWSWFMVPHGALVYVMLRHPKRFDRAATLTYAVFDIGAMIYWVLPTAPPWYAASAPEGGPGVAVEGSAGTAAWRGADGTGRQAGMVADGYPAPHRMVEVRRMMVEYGESFWRDGWGPLYSVLGGNPLAAMPSLHFATSVMAALLLGESGPVAGAVGWAYASTLGFALVYLGEHYVADLLGGAALTIAVRRLAPSVAPAVGRGARAVAALEARAHGDAYGR
jgi:membrane-associated phospholipid phosphatase